MNCQHHRSWTAVLVLSCTMFASAAHAQVCGDADGSGSVTVTDGVQALRASAGLSSSCSGGRCDVDASGSISVTDGVNVLRTAAGIQAGLSCTEDPFISAVQDDKGLFGELTKRPGGLTPPSGARPTVSIVGGADVFVSGRINTITIKYEIGLAQSQAAGDGPTLLLASGREDGTPSPGVFSLPLSLEADTTTIAVTVKDVDVPRLRLSIANGLGDSVTGDVLTVLIPVASEAVPACGNRVLDESESCDPPAFTCAIASKPGLCSAACVCEEPSRITEIADESGDGVHPLSFPSGIAVDAAGNVYVAAEISDNAFKVTPDGQITQIIDASGDKAGNVLNQPTDVAVDGLGNVYVVGQLSQNVFKIAPDGTIIEIIDTIGDGTGNTLNSPENVAVDGLGNVYVTGTHASRMFRIATDGTKTPIITGGGTALTIWISPRISQLMRRATPMSSATAVTMPSRSRSTTRSHRSSTPAGVALVRRCRSSRVSPSTRFRTSLCPHLAPTSY